MSYLFTSESVSAGHPDKVCDQISDAILDSILEKDPTARVACETLVTTGQVVISGEITTSAYVDFQKVVRDTIKEIGYTSADFKFDAESCGIMSSIHSQSPDIARGANKGGAGDQGMMFGYANNETKEFMPAPIMYAHKLIEKLTQLRKSKNNPMHYIRPDAKSQVTIEYEDDRKTIRRVDTIVISTQHDPAPEGFSNEEWQDLIKSDIKKFVIEKVIPKELMDEKVKIHVNPTGNFEIGGPHGDTGLTGRKIIVDTYGGRAPHGGGAFSGKDPTKVDRSAAYAARHLAKNIVAAGLADECLIQVAYAIGVAKPVSINVNTFGTGKVEDKKISNFIKSNIDLTPNGIIKRLKLRRPIYKKTAALGHFGRNDKDFTWEALDLVSKFKNIK